MDSRLSEINDLKFSWNVKKKCATAAALSTTYKA